MKKGNKMKYLRSCLVLLVILLGSCAQLENFPPVLLALAQLSTEKNVPVTLGLPVVGAYDDNGDSLSLIVLEGSNYTVTGTTVLPAKEYLGKLRVPVQVTDGIHSSNIDTVTITVVEKMTLFPFQIGSSWKFEDSNLVTNKKSSSELFIRGTTPITVEGKPITVYALEWINLASEQLTFLMGDDSTGTVLYGGYSPTDTLISRQEMYHYPVKQGDRWEYSPLVYNKTDSVFTQGNLSTLTCTNDSVYVTVPAGIFRCVEYTTTRMITNSRAISGETTLLFGSLPFELVKNVRGTTTFIIEKLYYAPGIGYVQNLVFYNNKLVTKKVLTQFQIN